MSKKTVSLILALALSISCIGTTVFADPNTTYQQELETNTNNYKSAQEKVDEIEAAIRAVNSEMEDLDIKIQDLNTQIGETETKLEESNNKVKETEENIEKEDKLFSQRMRSMYMNGMSSYVDVILDSKGVSDLFSRLSNVATIIKYDNNVMSDLNDLKTSLQEEKAKIEDEKANLVALKEEADVQESALAEKKEEHKQALEVAENNRDLFLAAKEQTEQQIAEATAQIESMTSEGTSTSRPSRGDSASSNTTAPSAEGTSLVGYAYKFLGTPYQWGGNGPNTFDCSGFTSYVFRAFGISLARTAAGQQSGGTPVSRSELQPGDLVFFGSPAYHVGIYVGNDCYIHAPQDNDVVKISSMSYANNFSGGRRY